MGDFGAYMAMKYDQAERAIQHRDTEIAELKAELARHHADFQRISNILEHFFQHRDQHMFGDPVEKLKQIRNIVG